MAASFNYANDADLYQAGADLLVRGQVNLAYNRPYQCGFAGRKARKSYRHTHDEIMAAFGRLIVHHEPLSPLFSRVLGDVGYVVRSPEMNDIRDAVRYILATE